MSDNLKKVEKKFKDQKKATIHRSKLSLWFLAGMMKYGQFVVQKI